MYDMEKINALLGLPGNEFKDDEYPDEPVNIATEIPQTTTAYGHSLSRDRRYGSDTDIDRSEVERYLSWCVDRVPLTLHTGEAVKTHVANVRSDIRQIIGVVTAAFQTIQNQELIDLADAVRNDQELKFCNAGVVAGGARVFFQCRGDSFDIGDGDEVSPFMLFCNGHDGSLSCRMTPMTKRIWCQNQLGNIVKPHSAFAAIRHTSDTRHKLEEAKRLGRQYFRTVQSNREAMLAMRGNPRPSKTLVFRVFWGFLTSCDVESDAMRGITDACCGTVSRCRWNARWLTANAPQQTSPRLSSALRLVFATERIHLNTNP